mmetsp:Transcript_62611/g.99100  ORF Transcript_62611/g.99100 Transcript_62611/m.99100 type:complete len:289 (+) Transcript_62611:1309-2175(+)
MTKSSVSQPVSSNDFLLLKLLASRFLVHFGTKRRQSVSHGVHDVQLILHRQLLCNSLKYLLNLRKLIFGFQLFMEANVALQCQSRSGCGYWSGIAACSFGESHKICQKRTNCSMQLHIIGMLLCRFQGSGGRLFDDDALDLVLLAPGQALAQLLAGHGLRLWLLHVATEPCNKVCNFCFANFRLSLLPLVFGLFHEFFVRRFLGKCTLLPSGEPGAAQVLETVCATIDRLLQHQARMLRVRLHQNGIDSFDGGARGRSLQSHRRPCRSFLFNGRQDLHRTASPKSGGQ